MCWNRSDTIAVTNPSLRPLATRAAQRPRFKEETRGLFGGGRGVVSCRVGGDDGGGGGSDGGGVAVARGLVILVLRRDEQDGKRELE